MVALILAGIVIFYLIKYRNIQPLKKKSPLLLVLSVVGNFLVILNISGIFLFFDGYAQAQNACVYGTPNWLRTSKTTDPAYGAQCMEYWSTTVNFWRKLADWNGYTIFAFSEPLSILPYLLRSLRIKKMFDAREIYCERGQIPKKMIANWNEKRLIAILLPIFCVLSCLYVICGLISDNHDFNQYLANYNALNVPMTR